MLECREHCIHRPQSCSGANIENFLLEDQRDYPWFPGRRPGPYLDIVSEWSKVELVVGAKTQEMMAVWHNVQPRNAP